MLVVDNVLISDWIAEKKFVCDLDKCHGNCCVYGDDGAPLEEKELAIIREEYEVIKPYMRRQGVKAIEEHGLIQYDSDGQYIAPLVNGQECAFARFDNGIAYCAIESAWIDSKTDFRKPVSCHLYPIRLSEFNERIALNYHQWDICAPALKRGEREGTPLYIFAKDALIRKFGKDWYKKFVEMIEDALPK